MITSLDQLPGVYGQTACVQEERGFWRNTTHDWSVDVDVHHLEQVRRDPARFAPGGTVHLVLEVLAYAADEADHRGRGRAVIRFFADGSVCVTD